MDELSKKKCVPCEGVGNPLTQEAAQELLNQTSGWVISSDGKWITFDSVMKNFAAAIAFMGKIAEVAEENDHHPNLHLTGYRNVSVQLSTHAIDGLSENDFILAAKINELPADFKEDPYQK